MEHSWKALVHDGVSTSTNTCMRSFELLTFAFPFQDTVSVHRPSFYADRFLKFMGSTVFKKIHRESQI